MLTIDVRDVTKKLRPSWRHARVQVLRGVTLEAQSGEIFGFLGPNGAGKTTTILCLLGVLIPDGGAISLFGCSPTNAEVRRRIGFVPESIMLPTHHSASSFLSFCADIHEIPRSERRIRINAMLERTGVIDICERRIGTYSKGQLQRLGIAQALLHGPDLVVLDEPTANLDPIGRRQVRDLLIELKQEGKTVFVSSHLLSELENICDHVAILQSGQVVRSGAMSELCPAGGPSLEELFFAVVGESSS